jgi:hypothetical protein
MRNAAGPSRRWCRRGTLWLARNVLAGSAAGDRNRLSVGGNLASKPCQDTGRLWRPSEIFGDSLAATSRLCGGQRRSRGACSVPSSPFGLSSRCNSTCAIGWVRKPLACLGSSGWSEFSSRPLLEGSPTARDIGLGSLIIAASWIIFGTWGTVAGLMVGVILLDFGEQGALVSN